MQVWICVDLMFSKPRSQQTFFSFNFLFGFKTHKPLNICPLKLDFFYLVLEPPIMHVFYFDLSGLSK